MKSPEASLFSSVTFVFGLTAYAQFYIDFHILLILVSLMSDKYNSNSSPIELEYFFRRDYCNIRVARVNYGVEKSPNT